MVLERGAGALGVMTPIFKRALAAAPVGNGGSLVKPATGQQWMSWIHIDDIVGICDCWHLDQPEATGPINGTGAEPGATSNSLEPWPRSCGDLALRSGLPTSSCGWCSERLPT